MARKNRKGKKSKRAKAGRKGDISVSISDKGAIRVRKNVAEGKGKGKDREKRDREDISGVFSRVSSYVGKNPIKIAAAAVVVGGLAVASSIPFSGNSKWNGTDTCDGIKALPVGVSDVKWSDIFRLDALKEDKELEQHIKGFFGFFQRAGFEFKRLNPETSKISSEIMSGQDVLKSLKKRIDLYRSDPVIREKLLLVKAQNPLARKFVDSILKDGKFIIEIHDREYNRDAMNGGVTMKALVGGSVLSLGIYIGKDYLKGAHYRGVDEKLHHVSIDGVLANELMDMMNPVADDLYSINGENIVIVPMGAVQRVPRENSIRYSPASVFSDYGYHTLYNRKRMCLKMDVNISDKKGTAPSAKP